MTPLNLSGSWVAVTGASSGLGRAIALRLAGTYRAKPILISRREEQLAVLRSEIQTRFGIEAAVVAADQGCEAGRVRIAGVIEELQATAALLSAGATSVGSFALGRMDEYEEVIGVNVLGFTDLLARILENFERQKGPSGVLVISSLGGETSLPFQAVYGASKAYTTSLVQGIAVELSGGQVSIGAFLPGGINTPMATRSNLLWGAAGLMDVDHCAALAISALVRRRTITVPGLGNKLAYLASRALPRKLVSRLAAAPYLPPD